MSLTGLVRLNSASLRVRLTYFCLGIGLQDFQSNGFIAALPNNPSAKMGLLHSFYGNVTLYYSFAFLSDEVWLYRSRCLYRTHGYNAVCTTPEMVVSLLDLARDDGSQRYYVVLRL
jgi:hypothetical protein